MHKYKCLHQFDDCAFLNTLKISIFPKKEAHHIMYADIHRCILERILAMKSAYFHTAGLWGK